MNINSNKLFIQIKPFVYIILFAYFLGVAFFFYLPKNGLDFVQNQAISLEYKKYNFYSNIKNTQDKKVEQNNNPILNLSKYELKAVYYTNPSKGWITIEDKVKNESYILANSEKIDEYELFKIFKNHVLFKKNNKEYKLELKQKEISNYDMNQNTNKEISIKDNKAIVNREYLNSYLTNIEKIWDNISIKEIKDGTKINGFKIEKINKDSAFGKLGLKEGDIIKSINNNVLESYADAFNVYNNIGNIKYLNMEILRNNEVMELNYEID